MEPFTAFFKEENDYLYRKDFAKGLAKAKAKYTRNGKKTFQQI